MFYISKASLKNLAKDTRRFSFVGSGVNAVTNLVGWSVMHHQESPMVMAGLAILWFCGLPGYRHDRRQPCGKPNKKTQSFSAEPGTQKTGSERAWPETVAETVRLV
ncbi:hypothetical protein GGI1_18829 [Acidithiobacillus sp. GGI-221]|nr:hypothetical protein GGI1_18829 [Acidithiobacillus sp. GGI-221]